ncbi:hypothetical protein HOY82DRAFT_597186 [Tuber indicum]|nr:hypothetical protein HOY82DRAFT_597186 [Tuber indicum]
MDVLAALEAEVADFDLDLYLPEESLCLYAQLLSTGGYLPDFVYSDMQHRSAYIFLRQKVTDYIQFSGGIKLFNSPTGTENWIQAHQDHEIEQHRECDHTLSLEDTDDDEGFKENNLPQVDSEMDAEQEGAVGMIANDIDHESTGDEDEDGTHDGQTELKIVKSIFNAKSRIIPRGSLFQTLKPRKLILISLFVGSIAELLKLVENPKSSIILPQHGGNKGRKASESIRVGYTVHIRIIGDESDDDAVEDNVLLVASSPPPPPPPPPAESTRVRRGQSSSSPASEEDNTTAQESKQEKRLARRDTQQPLRPTTPTAQQSLSHKRSLTILSPEQISTRTTRELNKTQSTSGPLKFTSPISQESASETGDNIVNDGDDATDNDLELGFQFIK